MIYNSRKRVVYINFSSSPLENGLAVLVVVLCFSGIVFQLLLDKKAYLFRMFYS